MKKIIALVGSQAGKNSKTRKLCEIFLEALKGSLETEIEQEIITADNWKINSCRSCSRCFYEGACVQDQVDGMDVLRAKLIKADCVIFASPVFAAAISGDMKVLIDRLSYWLHTMPLIGKTGIALSTASGNSGNTAINYMGWALETMGCCVSSQLNAFIHKGTPLLGKKETLDTIICKHAEKTAEYLNGNMKVSKSQSDYFCYQNMFYKKKYALGEFLPQEREGEVSMWMKQGYFAYKSMEEAVTVSFKGEKV